MKTYSIPIVIVMSMLAVASLSCSARPPNDSLGSVIRETDVVEHGSAISALTQLFERAALQPGDILRVREGGEALLNFGDGMLLRLFNDTIGSVLSQSAPDVPLDVRMYLEEGGFTGQLTEPGGRAVFTTPGHAEITVLGTEFWVVYDRASGLTIVGNINGTVEVWGGGILLSLAAGSYVEVASGQPPGPPLPLTKSRAWFEERARDLRSPVDVVRELPPSIQLSPSEGGPGTLVTVTGKGWRPADTVFVGLDDPADGPASQVDPTAVVVAATADDRGEFIAAFTFPSDARWASLPGVTVMAQSSITGETASAVFRLAATPTPPTHTPTATHTPSPTPTFTPTPTPCGPPFNWPVYIVQPGDNLFRIALAVGSTPDQLRQANCLVDDRINVGQRLFVPRLPPTATHTPTPTFTPTYTPTVVSPVPPLAIEFGADGRTLFWTVQNGKAASLSGGEFNNLEVTLPTGSIQVSPAVTTTYTLRAIGFDGKEETRTATVFVRPSPQTPSIDSYLGSWHNIDPATRSWTTIDITRDGNTLIAHFWGACVPSDCDAGITTTVYTGDPVYMVMDHGFATRNYTLRLEKDVLHVTTFTHFTDGSGRADYTSEDYFRRIIIN